MYGAHVPPQEMRVSLFCTLKLIASLRPGGQQRLGQTGYEVLQETSRRNFSDVLRRFNLVDNRESGEGQ